LAEAHVLWHGNLVYNEGNVLAVPGNISSDIRSDIEDTPCAKTARTHSVADPQPASTFKPVRLGPHTWYFGPATPQPRPTETNYAAIAYGKPGQPALSADETSKLRFILSKVRPCQRRLVRYAFVGTFEVVAFFDDLPKPAPYTNVGNTPFLHVLMDPFTLYAPSTGEIHVGPVGADDPEGDPNNTHEYRWQTKYPCSG
jgi:hypothetical protein